MTTQSNTKKNRSYIPMLFITYFTLIFYATTAADRLGGKFIPPDSPILPSFYPNDFLPWSIFLFLGLGWIAVNFVCKKYDGNSYLALISCLVIVIGYSLTFYISLRLDNLWLQSTGLAIWASYLRILVRAWSFGWVMGGALAFSFNVIISD